MAISSSDCFQKTPIFLAIVAKPIAVYIDLASLDNIDALLPDWLKESLIGRIERLLQFAGHLGLHVLRPSAKEEDGGFDDG
jgi:hypothetical protein